MKVLGTSLETLRQCGIPSLISRVEGYCKAYNDELDSALETPIGENFDSDFGGPFLLVETEEDLDQIKTATMGRNGYYSIKERADIFDICEDFGDYFYILLCTNNGGGTTYLVFKELAKQFPNIELSMKLTQMDQLPRDKEYDSNY